ncbi:hypothetical protein Poly30_12140 [Planctomycetes bacterium Poly30]|uniref:Uncharacterized protein n=1 Tax=Saltatorellus ferox TaxID=2528018 RepID=A0A518ENQ7_9BACT|nr:hypothetical protein Poly30_12140 [Planctomycetes bacterium Poly30]
MTELAAKGLRDRSDLREAVDAKLGSGAGISVGEAWAMLSNLERVEWIVGEFWFGIRGHNFHLWIQGHAQGDLDGPRWVAAIGRVVETVDPEIGLLMRWTAERGRAVRAEERGEPMFSIVTPVWEPVLDRAVDILFDLIERWPEELVLEDMEAGDPPQRSIALPTEGACRYPGCAVGFTDRATEECLVVASGPHGAQSAAMYALWKHGAPDDELERFYREVPPGGKGMPEALAAWVDFDGSGSALSTEQLDEFRRALDPIAEILGIESSDGAKLHRVKTSKLDGLTEQLEPYGAIRVVTDQSTNFLISLGRALRMDPVLLLVDSADMQTDEEVTMLLHAIWTGHFVVMGGDAPGARTLLKKIEENRPA